MPAAPPAAPTLAGFVLDETRGTLLAPDGTAAPLRPKTFALLQLLLRQRGELVGRQQILDEVWAGVTVTDDNVTQCIGEIRRALGEEGGRRLRTVPKRGYVLEVEDAVPLPPAAQRSSPWRRHPRLPLLALLLLVPLGLGALGWGFGRHTGPQPLASLTAQASVPQAMQFYEQGRAAASRPQVQQADNWLTARAFFEQAIAADPGFAPAYAEAAFTYTNVVINGQSSDQGADLRRAEALVRRAAELAPDLAVVHTAQAAVLRLQRRPAEALEAYRRAVALEPRQFAARANSGLMLLLLGRPREALDPVLQSLTLAPAKHPFTGTWLTYLGIAELQIGAGDFGAERLRSSLEWQAFLPLDTRRLYLAAALALQGRQDEAARLVRQVRTRQPAISISSLRRDELSDVPTYQAQQANFYRGLSLAGLPE